MLAALHNGSGVVTIIGLIGLVAWIADQTLSDLRHILRNARRRREAG